MDRGSLIRRGGLRVARIGLPLVAIGLLSTMFLVARGPDPRRAPPPPGAARDIAGEGMTAPRYAGVTAEGAGIIISAARLRAGAGRERARAEGLSARVDLPDGRRLRLVAGQGRIDTDARRAEMSGGVRLRSGELRLRAPWLRVGLDELHVVAGGGVSGTMPGARIDAGAMELRPDPAAPAHHIVSFTEGVRLLYEPGERE